MRMTRTMGWAAAVSLAATAMGRAQVPAAPTVPVVPVAPVAGATALPATATAAPKNLFSFIHRTPEQKAQSKAHFCQSNIGQFINNMLLPASAISGGLIGPCCPNPATTPNAADLAKPATSAQGAAAKIKAEEAQAKAKIGAIQYLATVDCRYYPEAEAGMITGLRAEKNECVRLAAAKALASGCCCTPKVVKALTMSVNCSNKDGFPAEASELVRTYAFVALERCMRKCVTGDAEAPPELPPPVKQALYEALRPSGSAVNLDVEILLAGYFASPVAESPAAIYADARRVLAGGLKLSSNTLARLSGPKNLYEGVLQGGSQSPTAVMVPMADAGSFTGTPEPALSATPASVPTTIVALEPVQPPHRSTRLAGPAVPPNTARTSTTAGPSWLTQPTVASAEARSAPRSSRKNLFNIFQDATAK